MMVVCRPFRRLSCCLISLILFVSVAHGQATAPVKTQISDVLFRADGTPASGTILISWPAFTTADGKAVAAGNMAVKIGPSGMVQLALAPNAGAVPAGIYYKATLKLNDGTTNVEYWTIPAAEITTIAAVRSVLVPASTLPSPLGGEYVRKAGDTISGSLNVTQAISSPRIEKIRFADQFPGSDAGEKIASAIADLPTAGGTVDARALEGAQTIATAVNVNKPVRILLGAATISHSVDAFLITANGAEIEGQGNATVFKPIGSASVNTIKVQGSAGNPVALAADAKEGDTTITLTGGGVATLGLQVGDYISIADTAKQQVQRVRQITGDTVMLSDFVFRTVAASGSAVRRLFMIKSVRVGSFRVDGSANNGVSSAIVLNECADCVVHDLTADNNSGYALGLDTGYGNSFRNVIAHNSGNAAAGTGAVLSSRQTHASYENLKFFDPASWGIVWTLNFASTMSNVDVTSNGRQQAGRGLKFSSSSYNHTTNIGEIGFSAQNFILEQGSSSNELTNCYALGNGMFDNGGGDLGGAGINTFGNGNNHNRFVNCTAKFNGGAQLGFSAGDEHNSIIGGEYCCNRGSGPAGTIQIASNYTTVLGANIWTDGGLGSPHQGIRFTATGLAGEVVVGNTFKNFESGQDISMNAGTITNSVIVGNSFPGGVTGAASQPNTSVIANVGVPSHAADLPASAWTTPINNTAGFVWSRMVFDSQITIKRILYSGWAGGANCTAPDKIGILDITAGNTIIASTDTVNGATVLDSGDLNATAPAGHMLAIWTLTGTCTAHAGAGTVSVLYR